MQSYYSFSKSVTEMCESYRDVVPGYVKADVFVEHVSPQEVLNEDAVATIASVVRERAHDARTPRHSERAVGHALLELHALIE
jgi:hypothetical protein